MKVLIRKNSLVLHDHLNWKTIEGRRAPIKINQRDSVFIENINKSVKDKNNDHWDKDKVFNIHIILMNIVFLANIIYVK